MVLSGVKYKQDKENTYFGKAGKGKVVTIVVGDDTGNLMYSKMKSNACARIGVQNEVIHIEKATTAYLLDLIYQLNRDTKVKGIMIQHPLPDELDEKIIFESISEYKDIDGVTSRSYGLLSIGERCYKSCTALGIMRLLSHYDIDVKGMNVVVLGRSTILGKPVATMLQSCDATVTVCHRQTKNLVEHLKSADLVVSCIGVPHYLRKDMLNSKSIVIDAGYADGKGDLHPECYEYLAGYSPVPGGVGPMTISMFLEQSVIATKGGFLKFS